MRISLPDNITASTVQPICAELRETMSRDELAVSFSSVRFARPFGIALLGFCLREVVGYRASKGLLPIHFEIDLSRPVMTYLGHMGFFSYVGLEFGKQPGEASGSENYLPMRVIRRSDLESSDIKERTPIGKSASKIARELAFILTRKSEAKIIDPISYCFREIIRNVFEHSDADECLAIAQGWPKADTVELAILDKGRGIRASLAEKYSLASDAEALGMVIKPGVSRSIMLEKDDNPWSNSGFGLFVLSEVGKELGAFTLISGDAAIQLEDGEIAHPAYRFAGTAVRLKMRRPKGENLKQLIEQIITRGERETDVNGDIRRASHSTHAIL